MHRPIATPFAGATLIVAPSVAPDLVLTLKAMNLAREDGRPLIELGQPAFALHQWRDGRFLTHFEWVAERKVLALGRRLILSRGAMTHFSDVLHAVEEIDI